MRFRCFSVVALGTFFGFALASSGSAAVWQPSRPAQVVTVATLDTGTNPFHPCFRRTGSGPKKTVPGYPRSATALPLTFAPDYGASLEASDASLARARPGQLYFIPGTNLSFYSLAARAGEYLVDDLPHGAQASSQIGCSEYGLGSNAHLVILNWWDEGVTKGARLIRWAAEQPWIDIIHLNAQDYPIPLPPLKEQALEYAVSRGKLVVVAAGNGVAGYLVNYPMELSRYTGPPGSLVVGANDNGGWTSFSNLDPHVVMDGGATVSADPHGYEDATFSGTSSSSALVAGYAARLLGEARSQLGHSGHGLLTIPEGAAKPASGPIADGRLTAAELHEVIRAGANPNPHESAFDGETDLFMIPQPLDLPFAFYPKMGYGEVSEHTLSVALDVLVGRIPLPQRPFEDAAYHASEEARARYWGD